jgi:elongation factor G
LKKRYSVEVTLHPPKVPYKETITQRAEVQGRHKKQTGGRGQFGDCKCVFEPLPRGSGFVFEDKIFGGSVPQQFRPRLRKELLKLRSRERLPDIRSSISKCSWSMVLITRSTQTNIRSARWS